MVISHEHKFIFLKTKKTAGTSIELALSRFCGPDDILTPISKEDEVLRAETSGAQNYRRHSWWQSPRPLFQRRWFKVNPQDYGFYNHIPAREARALLNDDTVWRTYFKFAFERNPWDRQVSAYHWHYRRQESPPPFRDFLTDDQARLHNYEIYSIDGEVCVDFMGRFENLAADLNHALSQVGIDFDGQLPKAKGNVRRQRIPYRDYYDKSTRQIVADWSAPEIKYLGYEF